MKSSLKNRFPIWQISFPLAIVLIFALGAVTAIFLVNGRYLFDLEATPQRVKIITDVDKRELVTPEPEITEEQGS